MKEDFYKAFEDKYRGSRQLIKSRLKAYLPFVETVADHYPNAEMLDLGCGRGEWVELMGEKGFSAKGVDLDDGMLSECRKIGLDVETADAIEYLRQLPNESQVVISAFHLVEHIDFESLLTLVDESLRVLVPGGLLILETPNPENLIVGTSSFYLDPTHEKPLPPNLLAFIPEYFEFEKVKVVRLQELQAIAESNSLSLLDVLSGVSPDYSIVAQKTANKELLVKTSAPFDVEYGLTLDYLATEYSVQQTSVRHEESMLKLQAALEQNNNLEKHKLWQEGEYQKLESQSLRQQNELERLENTIKLLEEKNVQGDAYITSLQKEHTNLESKHTNLVAAHSSLEAEHLNLQNQLREAGQRYEEAATSLDVIVDAHANQLNHIYTSTSWRLMGPIRRLKRLFSSETRPEAIIEDEAVHVLPDTDSFDELDRLSPQGKKIFHALKEAANKA